MKMIMGKNLALVLTAKIFRPVVKISKFVNDLHKIRDIDLGKILTL